jgi:hypothetical protein
MAATTVVSPPSAKDAVAQGFLLPVDADALVKAAQASAVLR